MKKLIAVLSVFLSLLLATASASTVDYFIWDDWGGTYADAEKYSGDPDEADMCWAAAAANVLQWTGWGSVEDMTGAEAIFDHYVDHFTPGTGSPVYAWQWWFTGDFAPQNWGYSKVDAPGGGNFWGEVNFYENYYWVSADENTMLAVDYLLRKGWGTALAIRNETWAHGVNCWGFQYDPDTEQYDGIWITDSEDSMGDENPPDQLMYYPIELIDGKWQLHDYKVECYITEISAIPNISLVIPEPATIVLLSAGLAIAANLRPRKKI